MAIIDDALAIDFGPDAFAAALKYNVDLTSLAHVLITHSHQDHLSTFLLAMKRFPYSMCSGEPLNVYGNAKCMELLRRELDAGACGQTELRLTELRPEEEIEIGDFRVRCVPAVHATAFEDETALNFVVMRDASAIFYGLDSGWYGERAWACLAEERVDCVVLDCTSGRLGIQYNDHMGIEENVRMADRLRELGILRVDGAVIASHFSHNGLVTYSRDSTVFQEHGLVMGYDGLEVSV